MTVSPSTEKALLDAMDRLLAGRPQHTDGALTKENLYKEAGVSRATMNRATEVMACWNDHLATHGHRTVNEARIDADLAEARRLLAAKQRECADLHRQLTAAGTTIAALHHDNQALRQELARPQDSTVIPLQRPATT